MNKEVKIIVKSNFPGMRSNYSEISFPIFFISLTSGSINANLKSIKFKKYIVELYSARPTFSFFPGP